MTVAEAAERLAGATDDESISLATVDLAVASFPSDRQAQLKEAVLAAVVPHWFDGPILANLLEIPVAEADSLLGDLKGFSFVERHLPRDAWNIHERVRGHVLHFLFRERPDFYQTVSGRAAMLFQSDSDPLIQIEALSHLLEAHPDAASYELAKRANDWSRRGRIELLQALAGMLDERIGTGRLTGRAAAMSLVVAARVEKSYRPLSAIESRLKDAVGIFRALSDESSLEMALDDLGDLQIRQGHLAEALRSYQASLSIAERLAAHDLQNTERQHDLSVSHDRIGDVQRAQGHLEEALSSYQASFLIRERLAARDLQNAEWQRDLSVSHNKIGDVQQEQGHLEEALSSYQASLLIRERLAAHDLQNTGGSVICPSPTTGSEMCNRRRGSWKRRSVRIKRRCQSQRDWRRTICRTRSGSMICPSPTTRSEMCNRRRGIWKKRSVRIKRRS